MSDAVVRALAASDLFGSLGPSELAKLAGECRVRHLGRGEQVFARGDRGGGMFLVAQGSVGLSVSSADGAEAVLAVLRPPQTFGELAVIDDGARVASATARQPSVLVAIPRPQVQRLVRDHPAIGQALLSSLAALVRRVDDQTTNVMLLDLPARVRRFLADTARDVDPDPPPGTPVSVDLRITQTELAQLVGGSRQKVNRIVVDLERQGAVHRRGARITSVRLDLLDGS
jgi:CRP/FNR family transcriptional regulator, cyclic AMP receptor protein